MSATPDLHLEGRLVATAEVLDTDRHDQDEWHHLFLFRADDGFTLVTLTRSETYNDTGPIAGGIVDVVVDRPGDVGQLEELVQRRWPLRSDVWWELLDAGRHNDAELYACWVPERMRYRDLDECREIYPRLVKSGEVHHPRPPTVECPDFVEPDDLLAERLTDLAIGQLRDPGFGFER